MRTVVQLVALTHANVRALFQYQIRLLLMLLLLGVVRSFRNCSLGSPGRAFGA